jgi:hypothetical protein
LPAWVMCRREPASELTLMRFFAADGLFSSHNSRTKGPELPVCEKATLSPMMA